MYYDDPKWTGPRCCQCDAPVKQRHMIDAAQRIHAKVQKLHALSTIRYWCSGCFH